MLALQSAAVRCASTLGPDGGKALAAADMPRLRTLRLPSCELGDAGAAALAAARWPELRLLDVAHNGISEAGAQALTDAMRSRQVEVRFTGNGKA